jgi:hypothetical protein
MMGLCTLSVRLLVKGLYMLACGFVDFLFVLLKIQKQCIFYYLVIFHVSFCCMKF